MTERRISDYRMIRANVGNDEFQTRVQLAIADGWQPWGPPAYDIGEESDFAYQAMVRPTTDEGL